MIILIFETSLIQFVKRMFDNIYSH